MYANVVVAPDWKQKHFGVRSVIQFFLDELEKLRFEAECVPVDMHSQLGFTRSNITNLKKADLNIIVCPWIVQNIEFSIPNSVGVVLDIAPILAHLGFLRLDMVHAVRAFSVEHLKGYDYYNTHCSHLFYISEETKMQYEWLYGADVPDPHVMIPFDFSLDGVRAAKKQKKYDIGLVNIFDKRKNFDGVIKAISLQKKKKLSIIAAGEARMGGARDLKSYIETGLEDNQEISVEFTTDVDYIYENSKVILFPTLFEGLGLPIIEAQRVNTPVISGSCGHINALNMNPDLVVNPNDFEQIGEKLAQAMKEYRQFSSHIENNLGEFFKGHEDAQREVWRKLLDNKQKAA